MYALLLSSLMYVWLLLLPCWGMVVPYLAVCYLVEQADVFLAFCYFVKLPVVFLAVRYLV
jgi:hypothetical protein